MEHSSFVYDKIRFICLSFYLMSEVINLSSSVMRLKPPGATAMSRPLKTTHSSGFLIRLTE
jgi:hypothetical protein